MSINNVYARLQGGITECENGAVNAQNQSLWLKGMGDGYKLALRILQEENVVPTEEPPTSDNEHVIKFPTEFFDDIHQ